MDAQSRRGLDLAAPPVLNLNRSAFGSFLQVVIRVPGHREDVNAAAWADDSGQLMLSGSDDRMVKVRWSPAGSPAECPAELRVLMVAWSSCAGSLLIVLREQTADLEMRVCN